METEKL